MNKKNNKQKLLSFNTMKKAFLNTYHLLYWIIYEGKYDLPISYL